MGEDQRFQYGAFEGMCGGTFLEMGGLDGLKFSNTVGFEKERGWKGMLIEASPSNYKKMAENRPESINVHNAVCSEVQDVHYVDDRSDARRGIWEFMKPNFRERNNPHITENNLEETTIAVRCRPLRDILSEHNVAFVDVFSLDVEGGEVSVLQSIDFDKFAFGVAAIETNGQRDEFKAMMEPKGYTYVESWGNSDWYVNNDFAKIYGKEFVKSSAPAINVKDALEPKESGPAESKPEV